MPKGSLLLHAALLLAMLPGTGRLSAAPRKTPKPAKPPTAVKSPPSATPTEKAKTDKPKTEAPKRSPEVIFRELDKNGDQRLNFDEFLGRQDTAKARERFAILDKNQDHFLSLEEFQTGFTQQAPPKKQSK